ncbi:MAG: gamma carbonic anhydrase family protein [Melioribacteraceae bacterium]|nr:gamma carbonic anhydrase family protein [Melioribacteraceae bacterium]
MSEKKLYPFESKFPQIDKAVFTADGVRIIGDVEIKEGSNIWYNVVIRGDVNFVKIGRNTNIQDNSMLHVTGGIAPLIIGDNVTVGHNVTLHGCTLKNNCLVGMGAIVLDRAVVEENSLVAAGSVVKEGFTVPSGKLVAGVPAKIIRDLTKEEIDHFIVSANNYVALAVKSEKSLKEFDTKNN